MSDSEPVKKTKLPMDVQLSMLTVEQVQRIDKMLAEVGEYGEVHIIVQKGELRYINKMESYKFWREDGE